jgi:hypothetical protein
MAPLNKATNKIMSSWWQFVPIVMLSIVALNTFWMFKQNPGIHPI